MRSHFGADISSVQCRHLDDSAPVSAESRLLFEWVLRAAGGDEKHTTSAFCKHVLERGVPLPKRTERISAAQFERLAADAVLDTVVLVTVVAVVVDCVVVVVVIVVEVAVVVVMVVVVVFSQLCPVHT